MDQSKQSGETLPEKVHFVSKPLCLCVSVVVFPALMNHRGTETQRGVQFIAFRAKQSGDAINASALLCLIKDALLRWPSQDVHSRRSASSFESPSLHCGSSVKSVESMIFSPASARRTMSASHGSLISKA